MILMHRGQRGAGVTKAWRGVRRFVDHGAGERGANPLGVRASRRVASCRVEDSRGRPCVKSENIAHRSDLAPLCISNAEAQRSPASGDKLPPLVGRSEGT